VSPVVELPAADADDDVDHHDYVWARLPFVLPMAIVAARRRGDPVAAELECLVRVLQPLLLDHLGREETALAHRSDTTGVRDGLHADHLAVLDVIDRIRAAAGDDYHAREGAGPTERALYLELARLDRHIRTQIALEEDLLRVDPQLVGAGA